MSALLILGTIACGGADGDGTVTRTDSAGIEIVRNQGPDRALNWIFERRLVLGGKKEGPESFDAVARGLVDADEAARIYVLDARHQRLVVFDSTGSLLWTVGKEGDGPGEFRVPISIVARDTIAEVFDPGNAKVERFQARHGSRLGSGPVSGPIFMSRFARADAGLVFDVQPCENGQCRHELRLARDGDTSVIAAAQIGALGLVSFPRCPIRMEMPPVFGAAVVFDARGARILVAVGASYEVQVSERGKLVAVWRRNVTPVAATAALAAVDQSVQRFRRLSAGATLCEFTPDEVVAARGVAAEIPAVREVIVAPGAGAWVRRGPLADGTTVIDVFAADGSYLGTLPAGAPFPLAFLPDGSVLAQEQDETNVERLAVYRVRSRSN